jgi:glycosyltransferase involved in cell wall biosynthesis
VTVLLCVHNDGRYLPESVGSLLAQTFTDFELLVIDDGSTDGAADFLRTLADPRVRVVRNETNLGLTRSLNIGLDEATGTYVARMDADDVALPRRLEKQLDFLEANPDVGVLGTSRTLIDEGGNFVAEAPALPDDRSIRRKCLLGNPLAHPTVMLRRDVFDRHGLRYDERYATAQDYELWTRLLPLTKAANLPEPLLRYRLRNGSVGATRKAEQLANHDRIAHAAIRRLVPGFEISLAEVSQLRGRFGGHSVRDETMDVNDAAWISNYARLLDAFTGAPCNPPSPDCKGRGGRSTPPLPCLPSAGGAASSGPGCPGAPGPTPAALHLSSNGRAARATGRRAG